MYVSTHRLILRLKNQKIVNKTAKKRILTARDFHRLMSSSIRTLLIAPTRPNRTYSTDVQLLSLNTHSSCMPFSSKNISWTFLNCTNLRVKFPLKTIFLQCTQLGKKLIEQSSQLTINGSIFTSQMQTLQLNKCTKTFPTWMNKSSTSFSIMNKNTKISSMCWGKSTMLKERRSNT